MSKSTPRTRAQENKFGQALGYAWGRKDATPHDHFALVTGAIEFATFYAMVEDISQVHYTLEKAWDYFSSLPLPEQTAYCDEWRRPSHTGVNE